MQTLSRDHTEVNPQGIQLATTVNNGQLSQNRNHGSTSETTCTYQRVVANQTDAGRLSRLRAQAERGVFFTPLKRRALEIAEKFKTSLRTGYRYARAGTEPASDRRIGRDGRVRSVPNVPRRRSGHVERELRLSIQALRRADRKVFPAGFCDDEIVILSEIVATAGEMLDRWRGALAE